RTHLVGVRGVAEAARVDRRGELAGTVEDVDPHAADLGHDRPSGSQREGAVRGGERGRGSVVAAAGYSGLFDRVPQRRSQLDQAAVLDVGRNDRAVSQWDRVVRVVEVVGGRAGNTRLAVAIHDAAAP